MQRALVGCLALSLSAPAIGTFLMLRRASPTWRRHVARHSARGRHRLSGGRPVGEATTSAAWSLGPGGPALRRCGGAQHQEWRRQQPRRLLPDLGSSRRATHPLRGSSVDLLHVLFGSAFALNDSALWLLGSISSLTLVALAILLRPLVLECLDPDYLATGQRPGPGRYGAGDVARLEGEINKAIDEYNKRPQKKFIGARTDNMAWRRISTPGSRRSSVSR